MQRFPYYEVIGLSSIGFKPERISVVCDCDLNRVIRVLERYHASDLDFEHLVKLTKDELGELLEPPSPPSHYLPDCAAIFKEINGNKPLRRAISKAHASKAWQVYLKMGRKAGLPLCSKEDFLETYSKWCKKHGSGPILRVNWTPAEEIQVDWAGKTVPIYGEGGDMTPAYIFVATSPYSLYTFARASVDMSMQSWLEHHRHMFEFFGGSPIFLVPDNLATAVDKIPKASLGDRRGNRAINARYQNLADYYGSIVHPARFCSPDDKAAVERHVNYFVNGNLELLKNMKCGSIEELNRQIAKLLVDFNGKFSRALGCSRKELFLQEEAKFLAPLPEKPFTSVTWENCKARPDATVHVRGVCYDIPGKYANKKVRVRITDDLVDIFTGGRHKQMIVRHDRRPDGQDSYEGFAGRRPNLRKPLDEWATENHREAMVGQWHPTKNVGISPHRITCHSKKRVWWKCSDCGYEWQESPSARTKRSWDDCPTCSNVNLVSGKNDLATLFPEIAAEWHPSKNILEPCDVFPDSQVNVWWLGSGCGHEWQARIAVRVESSTRGLCPYCSGRKALSGFNDVATLLPELAAAWHPANRVRKPENTPVTFGGRVILRDLSSEDVWLESPKSWAARHGYQAVIEPFQRRLEEAKTLNEAGDCRGFGMSLADGAKPSTKSTRPAHRWNLSLREWCWRTSSSQLLKEWHPKKNGDLLPDDVSVGGDRKVWWRCERGHEWKASVKHRSIRGNGCPYCANKAVLPGFNDLATMRPDLAAEWHHIYNLPLRSTDVTSGSSKKVWWLGKCGHEWKSQISDRATNGSGCPYCSGRRVLPGFNDLATSNPDLAAEWHPERNGALTPADVTPGSVRKAWWLGKCGHEWEAQVRCRADGTGCPYCSGHKALPGFNDLATVRPDLAGEWHPERNGGLTPADVTPGSVRKAWWLGKCGHEWQAVVAIRSKGKGCPYCSSAKGRLRLGVLADSFPDLAAEWHPAFNHHLGPADVTSGSSKKVWWLGKCGHEWEARVRERALKGTGCPYCSGQKVLPGFNDLATVRPDLAGEWHPERNGGLTPADVTPGSGRKVWWLGKCGHEWEDCVAYRVGKGAGCPYCSSGRRVLTGFNDLATSNPDLAAEWHPERNGGLTPDAVVVGSNKKVWWFGKCGHEWEARVVHRAKGSGCPYCGRGFTQKHPAVCVKALSDCLSEKHPKKGEGTGGADASARISNYEPVSCSLAIVRPDLSGEWHPERNGGLTPAGVTSGSSRKAWWLGKCGHEWEARVAHRTKGTGCPYCSGQKALPGFNDLATVRPDLAAEWHSERNGGLTPDAVVAGSNKKVWWLGKCGHEWQAVVADRARKGAGCPYCSGHKALPGFNDLATVRPDLAGEWHPERNGGLTPADVTPGSVRKAWWLGKCGHEWETQVAVRAMRGAGCPFCARDKARRQFGLDEFAKPDLLIECLFEENEEMEEPDFVVGFMGREPVPGNLAAAYPDLASEWHPAKNRRLSPEFIKVGSGRKVWWLGKCGHEWEARVANRVKGTGCPYCTGQKALPGFNDLATSNPDLAAEWHPEKNGSLTPADVTSGSGRKVWWLGKCGHEWEVCVSDRAKGSGCPCCSGHKALLGFNDLAIVRPDLAGEWHPERNGGLTPDAVTAGSNKKVWWRCQRGHEWEAQVVARALRGRGCPYCDGRRLITGLNDLVTVRPDLAAEWHPERNGDLSPDAVTSGSGRKVWWLGKCGHEWEARVAHRTKGTGCPYCTGHLKSHAFN